MGPGKIVVGIDGSPTSLRAAAYAVGLAKRQRSRLVVVFVRPQQSGMVSLADSYGAAVASVVEAQNEMETEFRDTIVREKPRIGVDIEMMVRYGDPFSELCQAAKELRADAVVVGRSESTLHRFAGSVAQRLVRCGRWPVTVVP
ncbi:universal stress protein [Actinoplanes sp. NPDC051851]|uniref:universal stress protein n=1 Tax=Actinoplanes sp. NPDC051851 TaxID=3154753 RepID=UPI00343C76BE